MTNAIEVSGLSKKYLIDHSQTNTNTTLRDSISNIIKNSFTLSDRKEEFWALKDISFEIKQGDRVGIIGQNGSGKSTLLKILSRIISPTLGQATIRGRTASLLEVGTGFHPELTGRENIYLNGAILGMKKNEIKRKFDAIVDFADIEKFLDTPVKRYSSGMYTRLAFSVAANLEPEILIVDEVLAVGDLSFQKKCIEKMKSGQAKETTVVFVSHNMTAIKSLCNEAIWLQNGRIMEIGESTNTTSKYLKKSWGENDNKEWIEESNKYSEVMLTNAKLITCSNEPLLVNTPIDIEFTIVNKRNQNLINLSLVLYNDEDICIFNVTSPATIFQEGTIKQICHIPANFLNDGKYRIRVLIIKDKSHALLDLENVLSFNIEDTPRTSYWYGKRVGAVRPTLDWEISYEN